MKCPGFHARVLLHVLMCAPSFAGVTMRKSKDFNAQQPHLAGRRWFCFMCVLLLTTSTSTTGTTFATTPTTPLTNRLQARSVLNLRS
ncbi:hypothetical protein V8C86DRAFT_1588221 [Haematococcus lacustris]